MHEKRVFSRGAKTSIYNQFRGGFHSETNRWKAKTFFDSAGVNNKTGLLFRGSPLFSHLLKYKILLPG